MREWLCGVFPQCDFLEAESGEAAVAFARIQPPDIVLMDIGLPQMNGIEATRRIGAVASKAQVVMLTVYEASNYRTDATIAGASAYVLKRTMHADLVPVIARLLAQSQEDQS